jgi:hypothetical protein
LSGSLRTAFAPEVIAEAMAMTKLDPKRRGETLRLAEFAALAHALDVIIQRGNVKRSNEGD